MLGEPGVDVAVFEDGVGGGESLGMREMDCEVEGGGVFLVGGGDGGRVVADEGDAVG